MKLLPDASQSRPLAIALLVLAALLVYLVGFHWFFARHARLSGEIATLEDQIARYKASVALAEPMRQRLAELRSAQSGSALFLEGDDPNLAAADLIRMLRDWVAQHATLPELCNVQNTQVGRASEPERFLSARVNVRMSCPLDDFVRILHTIEDSVPLIFVDDVVISQRLGPDQRIRGSSPYGVLDIRFEMYGYINRPGTEEAQG